MNKTAASFKAMESDLATVVFDRHEEIHTAILALITKKHHFSLGEPGIAKSMMVDELIKRISGLHTGDTFSILLSRTTTPDELLGGIDIIRYTEGRGMKRMPDRFFPRAKIAFLDEIFNASSPILNTTLKILNERFFYNYDDDPHTPLISCFAASNSLPQSDDLRALYDRLHFRHKVNNISNTSTFVSMLAAEVDPNPKQHINLEDIETASVETSKVTIGQNIYEALVEIKAALASEGITVTDRRWKQTISVIQAEAWLDGSMAAKPKHLSSLPHLLWSDPNDYRKVAKIVNDVANPAERNALELVDSLTDVFTEFKTSLADAENERKARHLATELMKTCNRAKADVRQIEAEMGGAPTPTVLRARTLIGEMGRAAAAALGLADEGVK